MNTTHSMPRTPALDFVSPLVIILLLCGITPSNAQTWKVLQSDERGCTLQCEPHSRVDKITINGQTFGKLITPGAASGINVGSGAPDLGEISGLMVLPGLTGHRLHILNIDFTDTTGVLLLPIPKGDLGPSGEPIYALGSQYSSPGWTPEDLVTLSNIGIARDRILGNLHVATAQYDAGSRRLKILRRVTIRVDYGPRHPDVRVGPPMDGIVNAGPVATLVLTDRRVSKTTSQSPASGSWYRLEITEEGIYRLSASWFRQAGIDVASVDPRTIQVFGSGGRELPTNLDVVRPDNLQEIAIQVAGESDGRFDETDAVIFYGTGVSGQSYDSVGRRSLHYVHRYDKVNAYLLTFGQSPGKRMTPQLSLSDPGAFKPSSCLGREFFEENLVNILQSGKVWVGKKLTPGLGGASSQVVTRKLEGWIPGTPVTYRFSLYSSSDLGTVNSFQISDQGSSIGSVAMGVVDFNTDRDDLAKGSGIREFRVVPALTEERSNLTLLYTASNPDKNRGGYVDWVEWNYQRRLTPFNDVLRFPSADTAVTQEYTINGYSMSDIRVFDVTRHELVKEITGTSASGGTIRFQIPASSRPAELLVIATPAYKVPNAPRKITSAGLLNSQGAEFIIIAPAAFLEAAVQLKNHRETGPNRWSTLVAPLEDIYTEFNGGVVDPTAIRNFIAYAARSWQVKARYVLLMGDGHYDYLNIVSREPIHIPVWESENSTTLIATYPTDDYYVQVIGSDLRVDLGIGRIPAQTLDEAKDAVQKIISYETTQDFGPWRNRVTFVADDGLTSTGNEYQMHTAQSELIADSLPVDIEQKKIYLVAYPTENTAQGRRKPDVNQAIINQVNEGSLVMNYTGHGSESVWAHEQVLVTDATIPQLKNEHRLTFIAAATCTFGLYDRPEVRSGMERMVLKSDGGAIAGLSSPRVVFSGQNSVFNETFFLHLFQLGRRTDGTIKPLGEALWTTKQQWFGDAGYEKFTLLGDPTVHLQLPQYTAVMDSVLVNGRRAPDGDVHVRALSRLTFHGSVRTRDNTVWSTFNGVLQASLFDARREVTVPEWSNWSYSLPGGLLYRGQAKVENGLFSVAFTVPKDISYENSTGRLSMYFDNASIDGAGYTTALRIGGTDSTATKDENGPVISLFLDTRSFQDGDLVNERPLLIADLVDETGINTTGLGIGHNIEVWVDESEKSIILNDFYTGELNSSQRGVVEYQLPTMTSGIHDLRLRAWDIHNNSSQAEISFTVANSESVSLANVMNYPNPFARETSFTLQHNQSGPVRVEIKIYTMTGRMIRTLQQNGITDKFISLSWDGYDNDGDRVANGIYFYKIRVSTEDQARAAEQIRTLSIAR